MSQPQYEEIMLRRKIPKYERRPFDRILYHYEIEKNLAQRLRDSAKEDRAVLYNTLYDELYRAVRDHPLLEISPETRQASAKKSLRLIQSQLTPDSIFLEVGPGDCALSIEAAKHVRKVYAIDVSEDLTKLTDLPMNLELHNLRPYK